MKHPKKSRNSPTRERSQRQLRMGELLRHSLVAILDRGEVHDPLLSGASVTVTEVRVSPDLRNATVFVTRLGSDDAAEVVAGLTRAAPFLRRRLGDDLDLRRLPNLSFEADTTFDRAERIDTLLRNAPTPPPDDDGP